MTEENIGVEGEEIPAEEPTAKEPVPYERFAEVVKQRNELKENKTPAEPAKTDDSAEKYLETFVEKTLTKREEAANAKKEEEQKAFEQSVDDILDVETTVDRKEFLTFMEEKGSKYGINNVEKAMELYKDLNETTTKAKEEGKDLIKNRPVVPASDGGAAPAKIDDSKKTMDQILEEEISTRGLK